MDDLLSVLLWLMDFPFTFIYSFFLKLVEYDIGLLVVLFYPAFDLLVAKLYALY